MSLLREVFILPVPREEGRRKGLFSKLDKLPTFEALAQIP